MTSATRLLALDDLAFLEGAYALLLGRAIDPTGLRDYLERLEQGTPKAQVLAELRASDEGRAHAAAHPGAVPAMPGPPSVAGLLGIADEAEFVERGHLELTGERPTPPRAAEALEALADGRRRIDLLRALRRSPAGAAHRSALEDVHTLDLQPAELARKDESSLERLLEVSDEAFLHLAYGRLLGRDPDASGRADYLSMLRDGTPRIKILAQLQNSAEGQAHGARLDGLAEALAPLGDLRQRLIGWLRTRTRPNRPVALREAVASSGATASPPPAPSVPRRSALRQPARGESMLIPVSRGLAQRLASRARPDAAIPSSTPSTEPRMNDMSSHAPAEAAEVSVASALPVVLERFAGAFADGWAVPGAGGESCSLSFGGRVLGRLAADRRRPDVKAAYDLEDDRVGFSTLLGGLLHFRALAPSCEAVQFERPDSDGAMVEIPLAPHLGEALAFSPLASLGRLPASERFGELLAIDFAGGNDLVVTIATSALPPAGLDVVLFDFYQEQAPGHLTRLGRYRVDILGEIARLDVRLLSRSAPMLIVATDATRRLLLVDCLPLPELHAETQRALLDYHSVLVGGQPALDVAARIGRTHLDFAVRRQLSPSALDAAPVRESTAVLLYSRDSFDFLGQAELDALGAMFDRAGLLRTDGEVQTTAGDRCALATFLTGGDCRYLLLLDKRVSLRPDFWASLEQQRFRTAHGPALIHWHSIWIDGTSRPYLAKPGLLLDAAFSAQALLPLRAALVARETVLQAVAGAPEAFRSGSLQLEQVFSGVARDAVTCVPSVLDAVLWPLAPSMVERSRSEQVVLPRSAAPERRTAPAGTGVSVIISYRDHLDETIRCLESLRAQTFSGVIELVLVNNRSTAESAAAVKRRAQALFGADAVRVIDYPHTFNHSTQCNLAARAANQDLLLMLSNDSVLLSADAIEMAAVAVLVPWIATVGFRVVGSGKRTLQSLGLGLAARQTLFEGGTPLGTYRPPAMLVDYTHEVLGNTFAAAMVRRDVYFELGGLDEDVFPTNYNDVDFCCRALQQAYRHVAIGSAVVEHLPHGSRERDLYLPADSRIVERCPDLAVLSGIGLSQL